MTVYVSNNIIYGFNTGSGGTDMSMSMSGGNWSVYNNTVVNSKTCIYRGAGTVVLKNNITQNCTNLGYSGSFNAFSTNNISQDATSPNVSFRNKTVTFIDASAYDFHLGRTDGVARDSGVDLSGDVWIPSFAGMTRDIDGDARPQGPAWDIGADEDWSFTPDFKLKGHVKFKGNVKLVD